MRSKSNNPYIFQLCAALILTTTAIYLQVRSFEFVAFDDQDYITENIHVLKGLTRQGFIYAFTDTKTTGNWHPLTWLSLMLDCELSSSTAKMCHTTNLLHTTI